MGIDASQIPKMRPESMKKPDHNSGATECVQMMGDKTGMPTHADMMQGMSENKGQGPQE